MLAGHYNLYCSWGKNEGENAGRPRITKQEIAAFLISVVLVLVGSWWILGHFRGLMAWTASDT